jgi:hypothetical protein
MARPQWRWQPPISMPAAGWLVKVMAFPLASRPGW